MVDGSGLMGPEAGDAVTLEPVDQVRGQRSLEVGGAAGAGGQLLDVHQAAVVVEGPQEIGE